MDYLLNNSEKEKNYFVVIFAFIKLLYICFYKSSEKKMMDMVSIFVTSYSHSPWTQTLCNIFENIFLVEDGIPGFVGFYNIGNTCFMNSSLQCILATKNLGTFFKNDFSNSLAAAMFLVCFIQFLYIDVNCFLFMQII